MQLVLHALREEAGDGAGERGWVRSLDVCRQVFAWFSSVMGSYPFLLLIDFSFFSMSFSSGESQGPVCGPPSPFFHLGSLPGVSSTPSTLNTTHMLCTPDFIYAEQTCSVPPLQRLKEHSTLTHKIKFLTFSHCPTSQPHPPSGKGDSTCPVSRTKTPGLTFDAPAPRHAICKQTWVVLPSNCL